MAAQGCRPRDGASAAVAGARAATSGTRATALAGTWSTDAVTRAWAASAGARAVAVAGITFSSKGRRLVPSSSREARHGQPRPG
jgi:hypothetical protein